MSQLPPFKPSLPPLGGNKAAAPIIQTHQQSQEAQKLAAMVSNINVQARQANNGPAIGGFGGGLLQLTSSDDDYSDDEDDYTSDYSDSDSSDDEVSLHPPPAFGPVGPTNPTNNNNTGMKLPPFQLGNKSTPLQPPPSLTIPTTTSKSPTNGKTPRNSMKITSVPSLLSPTSNPTQHQDYVSSRLTINKGHVTSHNRYNHVHIDQGSTLQLSQHLKSHSLVSPRVTVSTPRATPRNKQVSFALSPSSSQQQHKHHHHHHHHHNQHSTKSSTENQFTFRNDPQQPLPMNQQQNEQQYQSKSKGLLGLMEIDATNPHSFEQYFENAKSKDKQKRQMLSTLSYLQRLNLTDAGSDDDSSSLGSLNSNNTNNTQNSTLNENSLSIQRQNNNTNTTSLHSPSSNMRESTFDPFAHLVPEVDPELHPLGHNDLFEHRLLMSKQLQIKKKDEQQKQTVRASLGNELRSNADLIHAKQEAFIKHQMSLEDKRQQRIQNNNKKDLAPSAFSLALPRQTSIKNTNDNEQSQQTRPQVSIQPDQNNIINTTQQQSQLQQDPQSNIINSLHQQQSTSQSTSNQQQNQKSPNQNQNQKSPNGGLQPPPGMPRLKLQVPNNTYDSFPDQEQNNTTNTQSDSIPDDNWDQQLTNSSRGRTRAVSTALPQPGLSLQLPSSFPKQSSSSSQLQISLSPSPEDAISPQQPEVDNDVLKKIREEQNRYVERAADRSKGARSKSRAAHKRDKNNDKDERTPPHDIKNDQLDISKNGTLILRDHRVGRSNYRAGALIQHLNREDLEELSVLGSGASGRVVKCRHIPTNVMLALKSIDITDKIKRSQFMKEIEQLLNEDRGEHLVSCYNMFFDDGTINIALEYMDRGSLETIVEKGGCVAEPIVASIARQSLLGLKQLHSQKKVHRDIKPGNILVDHNGAVKISDFGIMATLKDDLADCSTFVGTTVYMSPERLDGKPYSYAGDIWSLGLTILYLCIGRHPIEADRHGFFGILSRVLNGPPPELDPELFSEELCDFVRCCLIKDPNLRYTTSQLLEHPFLLLFPFTPDEAIPYWSEALNMCKKGDEHIMEEKNKLKDQIALDSSTNISEAPTLLADPRQNHGQLNQHTTTQVGTNGEVLDSLDQFLLTQVNPFNTNKQLQFMQSLQQKELLKTNSGNNNNNNNNNQQGVKQSEPFQFPQQKQSSFLDYHRRSSMASPQANPSALQSLQNNNNQQQQPQQPAQQIDNGDNLLLSLIQSNKQPDSILTTNQNNNQNEILANGILALATTNTKSTNNNELDYLEDEFDRLQQIKQQLHSYTHVASQPPPVHSQGLNSWLEEESPSVTPKQQPHPFLPSTQNVQPKAIFYNNNDTPQQPQQLQQQQSKPIPRIGSTGSMAITNPNNTPSTSALKFPTISVNVHNNRPQQSNSNPDQDQDEQLFLPFATPRVSSQSPPQQHFQPLQLNTTHNNTNKIPTLSSPTNYTTQSASFSAQNGVTANQQQQQQHNQNQPLQQQHQNQPQRRPRHSVSSIQHQTTMSVGTTVNVDMNMNSSNSMNNNSNRPQSTATTISTHSNPSINNGQLGSSISSSSTQPSQQQQQQQSSSTILQQPQPQRRLSQLNPHPQQAMSAIYKQQLQSQSSTSLSPNPSNNGTFDVLSYANDLQQQQQQSQSQNQLLLPTNPHNHFAVFDDFTSSPSIPPPQPQPQYYQQQPSTTIVIQSNHHPQPPPSTPRRGGQRNINDIQSFPSNNNQHSAFSSLAVTSPSYKQNQQQSQQQYQQPSRLRSPSQLQQSQQQQQHHQQQLPHSGSFSDKSMTPSTLARSSSNLGQQSNPNQYQIQQQQSTSSLSIQSTKNKSSPLPLLSPSSPNVGPRRPTQPAHNGPTAVIPPPSQQQQQLQHPSTPKLELNSFLDSNTLRPNSNTSLTFQSSHTPRNSNNSLNNNNNNFQQNSYTPSHTSQLSAQVEYEDDDLRISGGDTWKLAPSYSNLGQNNNNNHYPQTPTSLHRNMNNNNNNNLNMNGKPLTNRDFDMKQQTGSLKGVTMLDDMDCVEDLLFTPVPSGRLSAASGQNNGFK